VALNQHENTRFSMERESYQQLRGLSLLVTEGQIADIAGVISLF
jgi:hypothetical protein